MDLDASAVSRWLEPLASGPSDIADIFVESRREATLLFQDGEIVEARSLAAVGLSARWKRGAEERLAFVSRADEEGAREAVRALQAARGKSPLPHRPGRAFEPEQRETLGQERWGKRLSSFLARHAPRHSFRFLLSEATRQVIPARAPASSSTRRLLSLQGTFLAASRRGDETRAFSFHAPDSASSPDELRGALAQAAEPRERSAPCGEGDTDVVLAGGCAAILFHEILSHPLESQEPSPLLPLEQARLAVPDLDVRDDATRLDLFGGYENDDEGISPSPVKLLDSGRLAGRLTDRSRAAPAASNGHARRAGPADTPLVRGANVIVAAGNATPAEMAKRLHSGLWIDRFESGSIELASGRFRLRFPRARRVRRGRLADECGAGILAGEILTTLRSVEAVLGREVRPCRSFGWCSRRGQVVPVQGAAPEVLLRKVAFRSAP